MAYAPRALVLGSAGNIGAPLVRHLRSVGYEVLESDIRPGWRSNYLMADLNHPLDLLPAFDWRPDYVFFLAAVVGRMAAEQAGHLTLSTNLAGVGNVIKLCTRARAKCIFFSSSEVYGPANDIMDDEHGTPQPNNRYGLTKWLGEQLVEYEVRNAGLQAVTLRPCMMYDENEYFGEHRSAMIRFAGNLARGRSIEVHEGSARGWLHIHDAVRSIEAATRVTEYMAINIGHGDIRPMSELAHLCASELGADPSLVVTRPLPPRMTLTKRPTLERMRTVLGITPEVSFEEGVRRVCAVQQIVAEAERSKSQVPSTSPRFE